MATFIARGPQLLMPLADEDEDPMEIAAALYAELADISADIAAEEDPTDLNCLTTALEQRAPDGWYFGVYEGSYGFWPISFLEEDEE